MSAISEKSIKSYCFKTAGEIDKYQLCKIDSCSTKWKTIDGMPKVKWSLKFYASDPIRNDKMAMYLEINSDEEVEWVVNSIFYNKSATNGKSTGVRSILLTRFPLSEEFDANSYRFERETIPYQVEAIFSYTTSDTFKLQNSKEFNILLQQTPTDFDIIVGDETVKIHKFILAAESPVFKRMFENDFKEARECKVTITDSDSQTVKSFIDYCYGQDISIENDTDIINLLYFADKYDCQTLKPQLENLLATELSRKNISLYVSTVEKANALQLRQACVEFVRNLIKSDNALTAEEMESFDNKFMKDVFAFNSNN